MPVFSAAALPALALADDAHPRVADGRGDVRGAVGGPVVDHDDLDRMVARQQRAEGVGDALALVVGGHDHRHRRGDRWPPGEPRVGPPPLVPPRDHHHEAQPADDEDPDADEQPVQQADESGRHRGGGQDDLAAQLVRGARGRRGPRSRPTASPTVVKV